MRSSRCAWGFGRRRLREQALGWLEGRGYAETYPAVAATDWSDCDVRIGGGESGRQVYERMGEALARLPDDRVNIVVSHGDAIRYALGWAGSYGPEARPWVAVAGGAVVALDLRAEPRWLQGS